MTEPRSPAPPVGAPEPATSSSTNVPCLTGIVLRRGRIVAWVFAFIFVSAGILTLPHHGLTGDEALGNMFFGERYLHYWLTLDPDFRNHELPIHQRAHPERPEGLPRGRPGRPSSCTRRASDLT